MESLNGKSQWNIAGKGGIFHGGESMRFKGGKRKKNPYSSCLKKGDRWEGKGVSLFSKARKVEGGNSHHY